MKQFFAGDLRVQFLSEEILRLEWKKTEDFCDRDTFLVLNRNQFADEHADEKMTVNQCGNALLFGAYRLVLPEKENGREGLVLEKDGQVIYRYGRLTNTGELPELDATPEVFALSDTPRILIPEGGYTYRGEVENSGYCIEEDVEDIYLLLCEGNAKKLRRLYVELTGRCELVRLSALGGWNSKYFAYNEETARKLILDYEKYQVPLDVCVIDTDWRECENGWGYSVNEKLFPDIKRFFDFAHSHGVEIMFNDHPEPVDGADVFAPKEVKYREENLQALMEKGLDIWWYDRNWTTHLNSPTEGIACETFGLYLFTEIEQNFYRRCDGPVHRRPVIMGNVTNVLNGEYKEITDSASHRYCVQWTGDNRCVASSLTREIENMIRCSNNGIAYVHSDCGGHRGDPDKELFIRWMQFGTLSPIFRPHSDDRVKRWRDPWAYDEETLDIVREYNNLRYRLLPVIYQRAFHNYQTGEPIFQALGYEYPEDAQALKRKDEYMLGSNILIAPIGGSRRELVTKKDYITPVKAVFYQGMNLEGEPLAEAEWDMLCMKLHEVSPIEGVPKYKFSARFEASVQFEKRMQLYIETDDGATVYVDGEKVLEDRTCHSAIVYSLCSLEANQLHRLEIEYFQDTGDACCSLYVEEIPEDDRKEIYLPAGRWMDVFDGTVYEGGKILSKKYDLRSMPLFVRLGALLPLAYEAQNTKMQSWERLVYDFYPDWEAHDSGYLYEDDTVTIAYKDGEYRKCAYDAVYDAEKNAFVIKLNAAEGTFSGERAFMNREITLKYHLLPGTEDVDRVTLNGTDVSYTVSAREMSAFPLHTDGVACDSGVLNVSFSTELTKEYEVRVYLRGTV